MSWALTEKFRRRWQVAPESMGGVQLQGFWLLQAKANCS
jgi:hypothetical protein